MEFLLALVVVLLLPIGFCAGDISDTLKIILSMLKREEDK